METGKKILVVEDDTFIQDSIRIILEELGYEVEVHVNGEKILNGNFVVPALFILDKQIPGVNGLDICKYLRLQQNTKHIPVIILSASPQVEKFAVESGANAFLEKPFKNRILQELISSCIN